MQLPTNYRRLEGSERRPALGAVRVGPADSTDVVSVTFRVRRKPGAPPLPASPSALQQPTHLSREEFAQVYGASQADLDRVAAFARAHSLSVVETSIARRVVVVSGTVEQVSRAFAVDLSCYKSATETYRGREGHVHLPDEIAEVVEGVFGLDNRRMAKRAGGRHTARHARHTASLSPLTPPQVASLYDFPTAGAGGQTIGLIEFGGGYRRSDVQRFCEGLGAGFPTPTLAAVGVHGAANDPGADPDTDVEVVLDVCVAGSVAPGARIAVYFAPWSEQGWVDVVTTAVHDTAHKPSTLSISWGWPELQTADGLAWTQQAIDAVSATFQEAAALGVTVFVASGDSGSGCGIGDGNAHVSYPGSDPWVTSCGGTAISNDPGASFLEMTWMDGASGTGGGISDVFALPAYQSAAGVPPSANDNHPGRGIPDVAGNADQRSGYPLIVDGSDVGAVGGTSAVAPLYAGLVALCNAKLSVKAGFLNPLLYALSGSSVLRDIADGVSNQTGGAPGYTSGPGWDACTGLGVIQGNPLLAALQARSKP